MQGDHEIGIVGPSHGTALPKAAHVCGFRLATSSCTCFVTKPPSISAFVSLRAQLRQGMHGGSLDLVPERQISAQGMQFSMVSRGYPVRTRFHSYLMLKFVCNCARQLFLCSGVVGESRLAGRLVGLLPGGSQCEHRLGSFLRHSRTSLVTALPVVHRNSTCFMSMTFNLLLVFIVHLGMRSSKRSNARRTENCGRNSNFREWRFVYPDRSCVEHSSKPSTETSAVLVTSGIIQPGFSS